MTRVLVLAAILATLRSSAQPIPAVSPSSRTVTLTSGAPRAVDTPQGTDEPRPALPPRQLLVEFVASRPTSTPGLDAAKAYALERLGTTEYACLSAIVERESRWDPAARNRKSGAFGLPQGIGLTETDPTAQLAWMIRYVDRRYGSACGAWTFWQGHGWY